MLDRILTDVRTSLASRDTADWRMELEQMIAHSDVRPSFHDAISLNGKHFICEIKRRSPSEGVLNPEADIRDIASEYVHGGAAAISVLTEPVHFGGSLDDLSTVADNVPLPVLRKDFVIDDVQIVEARAFGASAVLLIVSILSDAQLANLIAKCRHHHLTPLVEIHSEEELKRALAAGADVIGVNNRDLKSLRVDLQTSERLLPLIPPGAVRVAESGMHSTHDTDRMFSAGANAVLIGSSLMKSRNRVEALAEFRRAR
ncbi:MAG: indole-3-glycerol phosphate synthase TrpC [Candidatus Zixiibacteriota bacterium]